MSGPIWNFVSKHGLRTSKKISNAWKRYNAERPRWFMDSGTLPVMTDWKSLAYLHWRTEDFEVTWLRYSRYCRIERMSTRSSSSNSQNSVIWEDTVWNCPSSGQLDKYARISLVKESTSQHLEQTAKQRHLLISSTSVNMFKNRLDDHWNDVGVKSLSTFK